MSDRVPSGTPPTQPATESNEFFVGLVEEFALPFFYGKPMMFLADARAQAGSLARGLYDELTEQGLLRSPDPVRPPEPHADHLLHLDGIERDGYPLFRLTCEHDDKSPFNLDHPDTYGICWLIDWWDELGREMLGDFPSPLTFPVAVKAEGDRDEMWLTAGHPHVHGVPHGCSCGGLGGVERTREPNGDLDALIAAEICARSVEHGETCPDCLQDVRNVLGVIDGFGWSIRRSGGLSDTQNSTGEIAPNDVLRYTSLDMFEAWRAGAQWMADRVEIEDGELFVPLDEPCVEGRDWHEECGSWLNDFDAECQAAAGGEP